MEEAKNFSGSNVEPTKPSAPYPRMFWGISRVGPVRLRARSVELRGHPCAKDCMRPTGKDRKIMERDLGGLYAAVGGLRLNKVGGYVLGGDGGKSSWMWNIELRNRNSQFPASCVKLTLTPPAVCVVPCYRRGYPLGCRSTDTPRYATDFTAILAYSTLELPYRLVGHNCDRDGLVASAHNSS